MTTDILVLRDIEGALEEWAESDTLMAVTVTKCVEDQGTVVLFEGEAMSDEWSAPPRPVRFAVDNEAAEVLCTGLGLNECPVVALEPWQVL